MWILHVPTSSKGWLRNFFTSSAKLARIVLLTLGPSHWTLTHFAKLKFAFFTAVFRLATTHFASPDSMYLVSRCWWSTFLLFRWISDGYLEFFFTRVVGGLVEANSEKLIWNVFQQFVAIKDAQPISDQIALLLVRLGEFLRRWILRKHCLE